MQKYTESAKSDNIPSDDRNTPRMLKLNMEGDNRSETVRFYFAPAYVFLQLCYVVFCYLNLLRLVYFQSPALLRVVKSLTSR